MVKFVKVEMGLKFFGTRGTPLENHAYRVDRVKKGIGRKLLSLPRESLELDPVSKDRDWHIKRETIGHAYGQNAEEQRDYLHVSVTT